jgi:hypothetical protein
MAVERGAKTRGRVALAMAGADAIEIKATIPDHQIVEALKRYKLTPRNDEERYIYFFDTPKLHLLDAGIIMRARRIVGDAHDSTVKFRPVEPSSVGEEWRKFRDFKVEADASEKGLVKSASFSMPASKGLIKRVAVGKRPIRELLTPEQRAFIEKTAKRKIDFDTLVVLGPLRAHRWRFEDPGCPWPITAELWIREDRQRMMEMSIKAPAVQAAAAVGGFMAFLAEVGAERDNEQQTKTRWALSYYAGKHAKVPAKPKRKPAGPAPKGAKAPAKSKRSTTGAAPKAAKAPAKSKHGSAGAVTKARKPATRSATGRATKARRTGARRGG